ncbi:MAG: hypothetical protein AB7H48_07520 [Parachlamydiales bacterium]
MMMKPSLSFAALLAASTIFADYFPPQETDQQIQATIKFLSDSNAQSGILYSGTCGGLSGKNLPLSYFSTPDYWALYVGALPGNNMTVVDQYDPNAYTLTPLPNSPGANLQVERVNVNYGTDIYDAACWQIALGVYGKASSQANMFTLAENQTELLTLGYDGNGDQSTLNANRATTKADGTFGYNGADISNPRNAYFFRMVTRSWLSVDPFMNTSYISYITANGLPSGNPEYARGKITWLDWKPITGENAWGFLIGPIQMERLKAQQQKQNYVPFRSDAVQNAVDALVAFANMQSPIGAIYYACKGSLGNQGDQPVDPYGVSVENNASTLAGLLVLQQTLQEELKYEQDLSDPLKTMIQDTLKQIDVMINGGVSVQGYQTEGLLAFFKKYAWDSANGIFLQGGLANKPNNPTWVPTAEPKAVDVCTWGASVLGQPLIDSWFGFGTAYNLWKSVKSWGGFYGPDNTLWGVGYSDQDGNGPGKDYNKGIISAEWTAGAINFLRCMITQYNEVTDPAHQSQAKTMAEDMRKDHDSMFTHLMTLRTDEYPTTAAYNEVRPSNYTKLIPMPSDKLAFLYSSKRYAIPFGWFANPIPSTTSTSWAVMLHYNFNPFQPLGNYDAFLKPESNPILGTELPSNESCNLYAEALTACLEGRFYPQDLICLIKNAQAMLDADYDLSIQDKRIAIGQIMNRIIEDTGTPFLPDFLAHPLFKEMVGPFVRLLVTEDQNSANFHPIDGRPTASAIAEFTRALVQQTDGYLYLRDLPMWINAIALEADRYHQISAEEKIACGRAIYNDFIDQTNTAYLPDLLVDPILKQLGNSLIEEVLSID